MNNSKTSTTSKTSIVTKAVEAVKSKINTVSNNSKFVNIDGTIAESRDTYHEFRQDTIKSLGFGW